MPIYFQKISGSNFDPDGNFYVKDSKGCNLTMGYSLLAVFLLTIYIDRFNLHQPSVYQIFYLSIFASVYLIRRGMVNKIIMTINRQGFYYFGELITNWDNFIDAVVKQDDENRTAPYDLSDRFVLFLRYGKIGHSGYFGRKFLMTAVMDKSEEEIMAAIKFYYEHRDPGMILPYNDTESQPMPIQGQLPEPPQDYNATSA